MAPRKHRRSTREIVTLADLAPRREVTGGNARRVFGADPIDVIQKVKKDLPPKKSPKGGYKTR